MERTLLERKFPRDPVIKSKSQGKPEEALNADNSALEVLLAMADPSSGPIEFPNFPPSPENKNLIENLQGAQFGPNQELFDLLRGNKDFYDNHKDSLNRKYFTLQDKDK